MSSFKSILILFIIICFVSCEKPQELSSENSIISFYLEKQLSEPLIDSVYREVLSTVHYTSDLASLIPEIEISKNAVINPPSEQARDFSNGPVLYAVTAEDGTIAEWSIEVTKAEEVLKTLVSFDIENQNTATIIGEDTISVEMQYFVDISALSPLIVLSPNTTISPASGEVVDFSNGALTYTQSGSDGSEKKWTVVVTRKLSSERNIESIDVPGKVGTEEFGLYYTVSAMVELDVDITALAPTFTLSAGATIEPESGTIVDFSNGWVTYTVTSEDGGESYWKVYITREYHKMDDPNIQIVGRVDKSTTGIAKFSYSGTYMDLRFKGTYLNMVLECGSRSYWSVTVDGEYLGRVRFGASKKIEHELVSGLTDGEHRIIICKANDPNGTGKINLYGIQCDDLLTPPELPQRKIEIIGNSITVGSSAIPEFCDEHDGWDGGDNAFLSYGAVAARLLDAQWHISGIAGIGLIKSCCAHLTTMPDSYDRLFLESTVSPKWDFSNYVPDVVAIALGHNDGIDVSSAEFITAYIAYLETIRSYYPDAFIIIMNTPGGKDAAFINTQRSWFSQVVEHFNNSGDNKIVQHELIYGYNGGCGGHPDESEHAVIGEDLANFISELLNWN